MDTPKVSKRLGRPPKANMVVEGLKETPTTPVVGAPISWPALTQLIVQRNRHGHQIATVWHPDAVPGVLETKLGNVRVEFGGACYQLTTGEMVSI